jgi:hypothetical protein
MSRDCSLGEYVFWLEENQNTYSSWVGGMLGVAFLSQLIKGFT